MDWYPFDKQNCNIEIENFGNKDHLIDLVQKQVRLQGRKHVYQYIVEKPSFVDELNIKWCVEFKLLGIYFDFTLSKMHVNYEIALDAGRSEINSWK